MRTQYIRTPILISLHTLILIFFFFTFSLGQDCIDGVEVELWKQCYNIQTTIKLNLSGTGLSGEIPLEIGDLSNLYSIDLSNNQLTGKIPSEIGNLTDLVFLYLQDNQISGEIPLEIGNLTDLDRLFYLTISLREKFL